MNDFLIAYYFSLFGFLMIGIAIGISIGKIIKE